MRANSTFSNTFMGALEFLTLVYHSVVRNIRQSRGNALQALALEVLQSAIIVVFFYVMIVFLNMKGVAVRGSFILYVLTGVFLYLTHNKAVSAVAGGSSTSPMLKHAPVSTLMMIMAGALSSLYIQIFAVLIITFVANVLIDPFTVYNLRRVSLCFMLAWSSGVAVGIVFLAIAPFLPETAKIAKAVYTRANMIFSGKMFLANMLPSSKLVFFTWNPLFHTIDQARGAAFINYEPRYTTLMYPLCVTLALILIGMMIEHWSRKYVSESWASRR